MCQADSLVPAKIPLMLVAAADGAIMAGPVGATPPTVDGSEWTHAESVTEFQKENHHLPKRDEFPIF